MQTKDIDKQLEELINSKTSEDILFDLDYIDDFEFARHTNSGCSTHENSGCSKSSGCSAHSDSGCSTHSDYGCYTHSDYGCSTHNDSGCYDHTDTGYDDHSNSYYYDHEASGYDDWSNCGVNGCGDGCRDWGNSGCKQYSCDESGCYTHSDYGYDDWTDSGYDDWTDSGCDDHTDTGYDDWGNSGYSDHSNSNNHTNTGYNDHANYTDNNPPSLSGQISPTSGKFNQSIALSWPVASDTLIPGQPPETKFTYALYYRHKSPGGGYGNNVHIGNVSTTSYTWNTAGIPNGYVQVIIIASDGIEWSGSVTASSMSGSYLISSELNIVHYQAPSWTNVITDGSTVVKKIDHDELRREINIAREAFGLARTNFTGGETYPEGAYITGAATEMQVSVNEAAQAAGKPQKSWNQEMRTGNTIKGLDTREIRSLIETFDD